MFSKLVGLKRPYKQAIMLVADFLLMAIVVWAAFALRLGDGLSSQFTGHWYLALLLPAVSLPIFYLVGLYNAMVRFMGPVEVWAVIRGVTASTLVFVGMYLALGPQAIPRTTITIYWLIGLLLIGGSRFLVRARYQAYIKQYSPREPVAIYGAGAAGRQLALSLLSTREYEPVAFLDDNHGLIGTVIQGVEVCSPETLPELIRDEHLKHVLLAMPSATRARRRAIVESLENQPVHVRSIPAMGALVGGTARIEDIREVDIEDILGRDPVTPDDRLLRRCITDRSVMVTGAGGSIGAELCRQIIALQPRRLILFERSEPALYHIERELRGLLAANENADVELIACMGSVSHQSRLEAVMRDYAVHTVYHAAAYKHVPLVEANPLEGLRNNSFGTWRAALAARATGVEHFVLVSTDKAVRPTNVMGATKRLAELLLQALAAADAQALANRLPPANGQTTFSMVRFGNVLNSSGSVVPLFRQQIRAGGPVTVTHSEVTRYFMTIPEAASLVIQAGSMAEGGEVFVLDMGEPVRITDLARRLIQLSGYSVRDHRNPDGDIAIEYIGLRPGEKLYEELLLGENCAGTHHPMIQQAREEFLAFPAMMARLDELDDASRAQDAPRAEQILTQCVAGFERPGGEASTALVETDDGPAAVPELRVVPDPPRSTH
ncbi:polysaccharide biosynthesis protein [Spiribacter vilamensis]|nr:polysaccharide biosynthesis protein [Spiribacter vilamensis]